MKGSLTFHPFSRSTPDGSTLCKKCFQPRGRFTSWKIHPSWCFTPRTFSTPGCFTPRKFHHSEVSPSLWTCWFFLKYKFDRTEAAPLGYCKKNCPTELESSRYFPAVSKASRNCPAGLETSRNYPTWLETSRNCPAGLETSRNCPAGLEKSRNWGLSSL